MTPFAENPYDSEVAKCEAAKIAAFIDVSVMLSLVDPNYDLVDDLRTKVKLGVIP